MAGLLTIVEYKYLLQERVHLVNSFDWMLYLLTRVQYDKKRVLCQFEYQQNIIKDDRENDKNDAGNGIRWPVAHAHFA